MAIPVVEGNLAFHVGIVQKVTFLPKSIHPDIRYNMGKMEQKVIAEPNVPFYYFTKRLEG
jgi:hypothetical protein